MPKEQPFAVKQPFDLWPVYVIPNDFFFGEFDDYQIDITPLVNKNDDTSILKVTPQTMFVGTQDHYKRFYLPVGTSQKSLLGRILEPNNPNVALATFEIAGPGWYFVEGNTLRKATVDEVRTAKGEGDPPECDQGTSRCQLGKQVIESCENNSWVAGLDCAAQGQICVLGACQDAPPSLHPRREAL